MIRQMILALILVAMVAPLGCKKKEPQSPKPAPTMTEKLKATGEKVADKTVTVSKEVAEKTVDVSKEVAQKTETVAKDVYGETKEVTTKAWEKVTDGNEPAATQPAAEPNMPASGEMTTPAVPAAPVAPVVPSAPAAQVVEQQAQQAVTSAGQAATQAAPAAAAPAADAATVQSAMDSLTKVNQDIKGGNLVMADDGLKLLESKSSSFPQNIQDQIASARKALDAAKTASDLKSKLIAPKIP